MNSIAGNGSRRYLSFKKQVETFHSEWRAYYYPRIMEGPAITQHDLASLPQWHWAEPPAPAEQDTWTQTSVMSVLALVVGMIAFVRLLYYSVAGRQVLMLCMAWDGARGAKRRKLAHAPVNPCAVVLRKMVHRKKLAIRPGGFQAGCLPSGRPAQ
jgi:hypothetical protein